MGGEVNSTRWILASSAADVSPLDDASLRQHDRCALCCLKWTSSIPFTLRFPHGFGALLPRPRPRRWKPGQRFARVVLCSSPRLRARAKRSLRFSPRSTVSCAMGSRARSDETRIVYVSPLKALSNDINRNLAAPLTGISDELRALGLPEVSIRTFVRTGDTPAGGTYARREAAAAHRGDDAGVALHPARVGVRPEDARHDTYGHRRRNPRHRGHEARLASRAVARAAWMRSPVAASRAWGFRPRRSRSRKSRNSWWAAASNAARIVDSGHVRQRDLALEVPPAPLEAVMSNDVWTQVYDRLAELIAEHRPRSCS